MMSKILLGISLILGLFGSVSQLSQAAALRMTAEELNRINSVQNIVILDTRNKNDYDIDHIKNAISFPVELTYLNLQENGKIQQPAIMQKYLIERGLDTNSKVIIYDEGNMIDRQFFYSPLGDISDGPGTVILNFTKGDPAVGAGPGDKPPTTTLNYPPVNYYNDTSDPVDVIFNCSANDSTGSNKGVVNISLYITDNTNTSFSLNQTGSIMLTNILFIIALTFTIIGAGATLTKDMGKVSGSNLIAPIAVTFMWYIATAVSCLISW